MNRRNLKLEMLLKLIIMADVVILSLNFLNNYLEVSWLSYSPGRKLNNPLAILLASIFLLGYINPDIKKIGFSYLKSLNNSFFGFLILAEFFLVGMYVISPTESYWNLDYEKGYGTYFSTIQLYILGLTVLAIVSGGKSILGSAIKPYEWKLVAFLFMSLALDECIGIHDNYRVQVKISNFLFPSGIADTLPHWLWLYSPLILVTVVFLVRFFVRASENNLKARIAFIGGLSCWCSVLVLEQMGQGYSFGMPHYLLIAMEEGAEMLGATLLLFGFGVYLKNE